MVYSLGTLYLQFNPVLLLRTDVSKATDKANLDLGHSSFQWNDLHMI